MSNVYEFKKNDQEELHAKSLIDIDQPFDYEEVAAITGSEYIRNLRRDGMSFISYEELKTNYAGFFVKLIVKSKYKNVSGFQVADNYYYHFGHSWIQMESDKIVRVGIDDFTCKVFGPADTINLPFIDTVLNQGEVGWVLTRNDYKAPMQSPMSGTVCAINDKITKQPEMIYNDPYEAGWLFLMEPSSPKKDLKELFSGKACFRWMEKENRNLMEFLGPEYERLAATGGKMIDDIFGQLPEIDWHRLVSRFLHTTEKS